MKGRISRADHEAALGAVRGELQRATDRIAELHEALQRARDDRDHAANRLGLTDIAIDRLQAERDVMADERDALRVRLDEHERAGALLLHLVGRQAGYDDIRWVLTR